MRCCQTLPIHRYSHQPEHGYTLIELIMVVVLIGILGVVGTSMLADSFTTSRNSDAYNVSAVEARYAMERLVREIREVKHIEVASVGSYCIAVPPDAIVSAPSAITSTPTSVTFNKMTTVSTDLTNCATESTVVTICYSNPNLTLSSSTTCPTATDLNTLSRKATAFTLNLYRSDGTTAAVSTGTVEFVEINLTITDPTSNLSTAQRTRVKLRNG